MFRARKPNPRSKCVRVPIAFGIECGDGWFGLIETLCKLARSNWENDAILTEVAQIKEKYGGLRFYYGAKVDPKMCVLDLGRWTRTHYRMGSRLHKLTQPQPVAELDPLRGAVQFAEAYSYRVCETCGKPGKVRSSGWVRTLCDACDKKRRAG